MSPRNPPKDPRQTYIDFCAHELAANGPSDPPETYIYTAPDGTTEDVTALVVAEAAVITGG